MATKNALKDLSAPPSAPIKWMCSTGDAAAIVTAQTWFRAREQALQAFASMGRYPDIYDVVITPYEK